MEAFELRITKLEMEIDRLNHDTKEMSGSLEAVTKGLSSIQKNLNQIKWFATGATAFYIADQFGLIKALKLLGV